MEKVSIACSHQLCRKRGQKPKAHKWKQRFPIEWQICRQYSLATDAPLGSNDPAVHSKACEQRERRMEGVNRSRT